MFRAGPDLRVFTGVEEDHNSKCFHQWCNRNRFTQTNKL